MTTGAPGPLRVREGRREDAGAILGVLERAFRDDPFVGWLIGDPRRRRARARYFELMLCHIAFRRGTVQVAEEDGEVLGASLWAPPGSWDLGLAESLRILPMMVEIIGLRRFQGVATELDRIDRARPADPRFLLTLVGTDPAHRRRGIGRRLLAPILARCDRDGCLAALETSAEQNLPFYRRLGFDVHDRLVLGHGGPPTWVLSRRPV